MYEMIAEQDEAFESLLACERCPAVCLRTFWLGNIGAPD